MSNNNNNSDKTYLIVGIVCFLCYISSGAALFIRHIIKSDTSKKSSSSPSPSSSSSSSPSPSPSPSLSPLSSSQPQNCVYEWINGTVDKSTGKRTDTYSVITKESGGGTMCLHKDGDTRILDVKVDCEGSTSNEGWNAWSGCSKSCGPGTQTRTWNMTYGPKNGGDACPPTESKSCNLKSCKTCQSNSLELGYLSAYNLDSSYSACPKITEKSECENLKVNWGMGYRERVCDWK